MNPVLFVYPPPDLALRRRESVQARTDLCALLSHHPASMRFLSNALNLPLETVRRLLRTLREQGVIRRRGDAWELTGQQHQKKPRAPRVERANLDGAPRVTVGPAVQLGINRDPLVAALFGQRA